MTSPHSSHASLIFISALLLAQYLPFVQPVVKYTITEREFPCELELELEGELQGEGEGEDEGEGEVEGELQGEGYIIMSDIIC